MTVSVVFTGSRKLPQSYKGAVYQEVDECIALGYSIFVGDCPTGLDAWVRQRCKETQYANVTVFKADWNQHGRAAGPIRNREMVASALEASPEVTCHGWPLEDSRGTKQCLDTAVFLGVPVIIDHIGSWSLHDE